MYIIDIYFLVYYYFNKKNNLDSYFKCDRVGVNYRHIILEIHRDLHWWASFTGWVCLICIDAVASDKRCKHDYWLLERHLPDTIGGVHPESTSYIRKYVL